MNRAERRKRDRAIRKAIKTGVGVDSRVTGYRIVRPDGSIKFATGQQPSGVRPYKEGSL